jgi:hypothetical protein
MGLGEDDRDVAIGAKAWRGEGSGDDAAAGGMPPPLPAGPRERERARGGMAGAGAGAALRVATVFWRVATVVCKASRRAYTTGGCKGGSK